MYNKRTIILGFVTLVAGLLFTWFIVMGDGPKPEPTDTNKSSADAQVYSVGEINRHAAADDCWTIIGSKVYDITKYISSHPGGEAILAACGTDGTTLFNTRTDSNGETIGSGTPHSETAFKILGNYFIGNLED